MPKRYLTIWFQYLRTDWFSIRNTSLAQKAFVLATPDHGRILVSAVNPIARSKGIEIGMAVADARALFPSMEVKDDNPLLPAKLLKGIAEWCIRYSPVVAIDPSDGLILDISGCTHLWGGEAKYLNELQSKLQARGYRTRAAIADTIGAAWAYSRFWEKTSIIEPGTHSSALLSLPTAALRFEMETVERLNKLGLHQLRDLVQLPRNALRRRFGTACLLRLDQAFGNAEEFIEPIIPLSPFQERLPCLEPIVTATGIEIAVKQLLEWMCLRLCQEQKGLRQATLKCYRVDGKVICVEIGTHRPSYNQQHLFKLFEDKLPGIEPDLGIELFLLESNKVEDINPQQEKLWEEAGGLNHQAVSELLDRLAGKMGGQVIHRYLPDQHYWPERSLRTAVSLYEKPVTPWKIDRPRPIQLLPRPERIEVTAPIPDYPPMLFRYKGKLHTIRKADGPERIEQEWWLQEGEHRDYYYVEDEAGRRYWLFRSGHYSTANNFQWFLHGFFT